MNNIKRLLLLLLISSVTFGCKVEEVMQYDTSTNYIYVDMPFVLGSETEKQEEIRYSFAQFNADVQEAIVNVPVSITGLPIDSDRALSLSVVKDKTTALDSEWDMSSIENLVVPAGSTKMYVPLKVYRSEILLTEERILTFKLNSNENFTALDDEITEVTVKFSDILIEPDWWASYVKYFGTYYPEVYRQWQKIYYYGFDTKKHNDYPHDLLYWDNMPNFISNHALMNHYYGTLLFAVDVMKKYFNDNDIYPNGDTTLAPIRLP